MTDMEKAGLVESDEIHRIVVQIREILQDKKPDLLDMYIKGLKVMLTSDGLYLTDRQIVGDLKKDEGIYSIIEVLTVEELHEFMVEFYQYIKQGQGYAVLQIMEYKLKEKMDDVYEDNYEILFKDLEGKQKQSIKQSGGTEHVNWNKWENAVW